MGGQQSAIEVSICPLLKVKEEARKLVDELPDDATWDDLEYKIYVRRKIERGLESVEQGDTLSTDEVRRRLGVDKE